MRAVQERVPMPYGTAGITPHKITPVHHCRNNDVQAD
jgi:hypothetical protein